jgi:nicotinamide-nucleotide amidase
VAAVLLDRQVKVTVAESCTGGYVAKLLTDVPGSSRWFECGFVTYSNEAKRRDLGVTAEALAEHGAVSERTVLEMAVGAMARAGVHRSISISGVAGPDGGTDAHPVGDVWFGKALKLDDGSANVLAMHRRFAGDRDAVRRHSVAFALDLLLEG